LAARVHVEANELGEAATRLERVMKGSDDPQLQLVARVRLARVQIAQGNADAALATLGAVDPGAFAARFDDVRGDALHVKGDRAAALAAWQKAEAASSDPTKPATVDLEGLRLKIADAQADGIETPKGP
jgi:predicted negative regulator of RcsB-dependent stress response